MSEERAVRASNVRKDPTPRSAKADLSAQESAILRDRLIADLNRLQSSDEAADWVHKNLAAKNTLMAADADCVEASFRERLSTSEPAPAVAEGQLEFAKDDGVEPPGGQAFAETIDASAAAPSFCPKSRLAIAAYLPKRSGFATRSTAICHNPALRRVRADPERSTPHSLRPAACARPKGQRRIHGPRLSPPSPGIPPLRR